MQLREHESDTLIQVREHRGEDAAMDVGNMAELLQKPVGRLHRAMDGVVGEGEEEGLRAVPLDEIARLAGERVGEMRGLVFRLAATENRIVGVVVGFLVPEVRAPDHAAIGGGPTAGAAVG